MRSNQKYLFGGVGNVKKMLPVLLVTLLVLSLLGIKYYPELQSFFANNDHINGQEIAHDTDKTKEVNEDSQETKKEHRDKIKPEQFPFETKEEKKLAQNYPKKFSIVEKMFYSWDYLHNVQGVYEHGRPIIGEMSKIEFYVDFDKIKNRASFKEYANGEIRVSEELLLKDGTALRQNPERNIYTKDPIYNNPRKNADYLQKRYLVAYNGYVTTSQWISLLENKYPDWNYKIGEKFGIPVYQIKGKISEEWSEDLAGTYTMTVAKDTGVLLDLKNYNRDNELIQYLTVKDIQINQGIEDNVFQLDFSGSEQVAYDDYNTYGKGIEPIVEEKTGGVDTSDD